MMETISFWLLVLARCVREETSRERRNNEMRSKEVGNSRVKLVHEPAM